MRPLRDRLLWRYAVKRYDRTKRIDPALIDELRNAIVMAPSSFGLQPYRVIMVSDPALKERLAVASYRQPQIVEADYIAVFAIETALDESLIDRYFANVRVTRGVEPAAAHRASISAALDHIPVAARPAWATHQAYLALGFALMAAAELEIDANPMEGFIASSYDDLLGLRELGLHAVVICGLGYRSASDPFAALAKVRKPDLFSDKVPV
ncbi:MAG TPA: NAD(P)H-dependent oxidoreductase [Polyangiales bacterium]|jgi:nitroreductase|nr:NAD(P)H-dependent oxidoreductase [Polyangiales bacterium]